MEKIAIISDIHGNISALNAVLEDIKKRNIKRIFGLGDYITKCVHPNLVIDTVRENCEVLLKGNSDDNICNPRVRNKKYWSYEKIGEERAEFLHNLPVSYDFYLSGHLIRLFHASPHGLDHMFNPMFSNKNTPYSGVELNSPAELFENTAFIGKTENDPIPDIVGYGHIHTPNILRARNKTIFNPGSVGAPIEMLNDDPFDKTNQFSTVSSYIILEGILDSKKLAPISFNLVRLPYDIEAEVKLLRESGLPSRERLIAELKSATNCKNINSN